jgi:UDP-N-acetylglucosamine 2-epimerase (non-hydrolysing)
MPEEINRIVTDALSEVLLVSEASGVKNLRAEGVPEERIHLVGNLMIDSLERHVGEARRLGMATRMGERPGGYGLVTLHRPANVDDLSALSGILEALKQISEELPLIFPVHPRTRGRLEEARVWEGARIRLTDPLGYVEFLGLMADSAAVLTDSGGIQEETTVLGVPCLTLRENTERPATIEEGTNVLAGTKKEGILEAWARMRGRSRTGRVPQFWDGRSAERCVAVLESYFCGPPGRSARR